MLLNLPLPQHITVEILLRLPFESILSCKLVSTQLKNLINDPNFCNLYNNKSVALYFGTNGLHCLLTRHANNNHKFPLYTVHRIPIGLTKRSSDDGFLDFDLLSGSSNTIACVKPRHGGDYLLYNLLTGASYTVRASPKQREYPPSWICFGFGYDRYADDYKMLEVYNCDTRTSKEKCEGVRLDMDTDRYWVYSFGNRCWESFHGYPYASYHRPIWNAACSFNGVLHWVVVTRDLVPENRKRVVLTYDLRARKFGEVSLPAAGSNVVPLDERGTTKVSELEGRLCYAYQKELSLCVWVMQEYGVRESWTKLLAVEDVRTRFNRTMFGQATPAMSFGKVLLFGRHIGVKLFWYDMDNKEIQVVAESFRTADVATTDTIRL